ncbi:MAG: glycosyl hydrolase family 28-related protein [Saprospiraceae bacterium]
MKIIYALIIFVLGVITANAQTVTYYQTGEEFSGPFPSWKNVKTDFGAMGDGITNDAPAINAALFAMRRTQTNPYNVLYFPAGTYLIDSTLYNPNRSVGDDYAGLAIIGEDPATTIILASPAFLGSKMLTLNGWYMRVSRLTFNGSNKAGTAIFHSGGFSTGCEWSDLDFTGCCIGIDFSSPTNGQAENAILRCTFNGCCFTGINSNNWNSLDHWVWGCLFQDCHHGINLGNGYYQIYNNVFINNWGSDIGGGNTYQSAVVNNISFNSPCFFASGPGYLRGNKIYSNVDSFYTVGAQMIDNTFRIGNTHYPIQRIVGLNIVGTKNLMVGNTYSNAQRKYPFCWAVQPPRQNFDHAIGANYIINHPIEKAIDNDSTTWFTCGLWNQQAGIRWNCEPQSPRTIVQYTIRQGTQFGDTLSDPKNFQLRASNDWGNTWTVLDSEVNQHFKWREKKTYIIPNATAYSLYEFTILLNRGNISPGTGGWISFSDVQLFDVSGNDITQDTTGLLTGADELWGKYYPISNVVVDSSSIIVPKTVSLPGTPLNMHRTIFEVQQGTGNDAAAIQGKIDSAAMLPLGSKPVVHIPKGTYNVKTTLVVPALKDMQLVGDGTGSGTISRVDWTGNNTGPLIKCLGPSRVTMKDIWFNISYHQNAGMDAIAIEDADQPGGRIYANQFFAGSLDAAHSADIGIYSDGVENSDITITCSSFGSALNGVVKAKGGPVLSSGGNTNGQISCLTGAFGGTQNLFSISNGGRINAEGMWYEGYAATNTSGLINLTNTSGKLSIACMQWFLDKTSLPIISTDNFSGSLTLLDNSFNQIPGTKLLFSGDGTGSHIFSAYNFFGSAATVGLATDSIWEDTTSPHANASMLGCNAGSGINSTQLNDVVNTVHNFIPDDTFVLNSLSQLRAVRTDPPNDMIAGVTDVKLFRIASRVVEGNIAAHFIASPVTGIEEIPLPSYSHLLVYPNPFSSETTLQTDWDLSDATITVYNLFGQIVKESKHNSGQKITFYCENLSGGIYFVRIVQDGKIIATGKLLIVD